MGRMGKLKKGARANRDEKKVANENRRRIASEDVYDDEDGDQYDEVDMSQPKEVVLKPDDQVQGLTEADLSETFTRFIACGDPNVPQMLTYFNYGDEALGEDKKCTYVPDMQPDFIKIHFHMEGDLIDQNSDQARWQLARKAAQAEAEAAKNVETNTEEDNPEGGEPAFDAGDMKIPQPKKVRNQFNYSERATQTFNNPQRTKEVCTEPPPTQEFNEQCSQWVIFDTYLEDIERKIVSASIMEKAKNKKRGADAEEEEREEVVVYDDVFHNPAFNRAMKMMERMVHTSSEDSIFAEYKYDRKGENKEKEEGKGFWPLWRFSYDLPNIKEGTIQNVTSIAWNPTYTDLFAVGYGSYDFINQGTGLICCYTLKNTSHPEFVFETDKGVMSLDFNKDHPSLLCVGLYDGAVAVYDLKKSSTDPIFASSSPKTKHTDTVWQVNWGKETNEGINFYSISSDGHVVNWTLSKTELAKEEVVSLKLVNEPVSEDMDSSILGLAGGSCFDFNDNNEHMFVVGTEEGSIQTYSKEFNAEFLRSFQGHHMAVYSVRWNAFHPDVFLSCSADWTVKLWEVNTPTPIMTFDLNTSIGDVAWSPHSSTVFATITWDGWVRLYDLAINKHEPIAKENLNKDRRGSKDKDKVKLTKISFNPVEPILCVGDDRGVVIILKLANMFKKIVPRAEMDEEAECARLEALMIMPDEDKSDAALLEAAAKGNTNVGD